MNLRSVLRIYFGIMRVSAKVCDTVFHYFKTFNCVSSVQRKNMCRMVEYGFFSSLQLFADILPDLVIGFSESNFIIFTKHHLHVASYTSGIIISPQSLLKDTAVFFLRYLLLDSLLKAKGSLCSGAVMYVHVFSCVHGTSL